MRLPVGVSLLIVGAALIGLVAVTLVGRAVLAPFIGSVVDAKAQAEQIVDGYYAAEQSGDDATAVSYFSERVLTTTPAATIRTNLQNTRATWGSPQSHQETAFKVQEGAQQFGPGTTVDLTYAVTYGSHSGTEQFTLFRPSDGATMQIMAHRLALN